jgi:hypothetical protein
MMSFLSVLLIFAFATSQTLAAPATTKTKTKVVHKQAPVQRGLIPPPPPSVPIGGSFLFMGSPTFMTPNDLKKHRADLCQQLAEMKRTVEDTDKRITERKDRAKLFEGLYKEGVVSKRELETAQDSVNQTTHELEQDKQKLNRLQEELDQIDTILKQQPKKSSNLHPIYVSIGSSNLAKDLIKTR